MTLCTMKLENTVTNQQNTKTENAILEKDVRKSGARHLFAYKACLYKGFAKKYLFTIEYKHIVEATAIHLPILMMIRHFCEHFFQESSFSIVDGSSK